MATKKKKKATRKPKGTARKAPRAKLIAKPLPPGARDIGMRERRLRDAIEESRLQADVDEVRGYFPSEENITAEDVAGAADALASAPLPTMADRRYEAPPERVPREPECHVYVAPEPGEVPVLPDLTGVTLEFHTTRCFTWIDIAFALLPEAGVVIRRSHDRLNGGSTYLLAGSADLDEHQYGGEIGSHHWYEATDEQHDAIAACDPDAAPQPFEEAVGVAQ